MSKAFLENDRQKFEFLKDYGFKIRVGQIVRPSMYALHPHQPIGIHFYNDEMNVDDLSNKKTFHKISGWRSISLNAFKMICYALGIVPCPFNNLPEAEMTEAHLIQVAGSLS